MIFRKCDVILSYKMLPDTRDLGAPKHKHGVSQHGGRVAGHGQRTLVGQRRQVVPAVQLRFVHVQLREESSSLQSWELWLNYIENRQTMWVQLWRVHVQLPEESDRQQHANYGLITSKTKIHIMGVSKKIVMTRYNKRAQRALERSPETKGF